jgi:hypothetical protein
MASGGTRPAGSALALQKTKEQQINDLLLPFKPQLLTQG